MFRLPFLAGFLRWVGLLGIGLMMLDGSYWRESVYDERNFPDTDIHSGNGRGDV